MTTRLATRNLPSRPSTSRAPKRRRKEKPFASFIAASRPCLRRAPNAALLDEEGAKALHPL